PARRRPGPRPCAPRSPGSAPAASPNPSPTWPPSACCPAPPRSRRPDRPARDPEPPPAPPPAPTPLRGGPERAGPRLPAGRPGNPGGDGAPPRRPRTLHDPKDNHVPDTWLDIAPDAHFGPSCLPYGVFSTPHRPDRPVGGASGDPVRDPRPPGPAHRA